MLSFEAKFELLPSCLLMLDEIMYVVPWLCCVWSCSDGWSFGHVGS
jgi:hypothetical protein